MKIKDGKIKLEKNDTQLHNFILTQETEYVKITAVGATWNIRYHNTLPKARFIIEGLKMGLIEQVEGIIKIDYAMTTCIPDKSFIEDCLNIYNARIDRSKIEISEEEDQEILRQEKEFYAAKKQLRNE